MLQAHKLPRGKRFSHVLHAAADSTLGPQLSPLQRYDQIVSGTRQMLDFALACGAQRFLLTSSGGVYGRMPAGMVTVPETYHGMPDPMDPQQAYGVAKRAAEHLCALYDQSSGLEVVVARCFAFVGPDLPLNVHFAIGNFIRDALHGDRITVSGDGSPLRSYLDQADLARWLMLLLHKGEAGAAYNVGSDEAISIAELANLVRDTLTPGKSVDIIGGSNFDHSQRSIYVPDIQKIKTGLGASVSVSLRDAITRAAQAAVLGA
ncbi:dTDP-glucose 4,6-dehydratase [Rhodoferax antarcticus]|nr:dTDP-glucose 4,6-dehydratase [Rhodoferax antarcticus]